MKLCIALLSLLISWSAVAQDQAENDQGAAQIQPQFQTQASRPIEEIEVTSQRSFFLLRLDLENAQEAVFSTFNDLNVDDDFDIDCRQTDYTHTRIQDFVCYPAFFDNAIAKNAQDSFLGLDVHLNPMEIRNNERGNFEKLVAIMTAIAEENDSLKDMLLELGALEQEIQRRHEECMQQPAVLFLFRRC